MLIDNDVQKNKRYETIYLVGPNASLQNLEYVNQDSLIVANKITEKTLNLGNNVMYVLNMSWGTRSVGLIEEAIKKCQIIYLPEIRWLNNLTNYGNIHEYRIELSEFTDQSIGISPMGLQRALILIIRNFEFQHIKFVGFDFGLANSPYKNWYPSLMREREGIEKGIKHSYKRHCIRYNFMLTKTLLKYTQSKRNGKSEVERICELDLCDFEDYLRKRYRLR